MVAVLGGQGWGQRGAMMLGGRGLTSGLVPRGGWLPGAVGFGRGGPAVFSPLLFSLFSGRGGGGT